MPAIAATSPPVALVLRIEETTLVTVSDVVVALVNAAVIAESVVAVALVVFNCVANKFVLVAFVEVEKLEKRLAIVDDAVEYKPPVNPIKVEVAFALSDPYVVAVNENVFASVPQESTPVAEAFTSHDALLRLEMVRSEVEAPLRKD